MPGASDLIQFADWLDPVSTLLVGAAILVYLRQIVQPRIEDLEAVQERRGDRLDDHELTEQELALLVDDNAEHVDRVDDAVQRLKRRVRDIEETCAAHHGRPPGGQSSHREPRSDGSNPRGDAGEDDESDDDESVLDEETERATARLRSRISRIVDGHSSTPSGPNLTERHKRDRANGHRGD